MSGQKSYERKRNFEKTPEPSPSTKKYGDKPLFTIQKHDAQNLHYDFRLEIRGSLKSWAIPKGPSVNPADKRLAIPTEDHPMDYADFEGVIPEDQYGGGTVMVWDRGTYQNIKTKEGETVPLNQCYKDGQLEIFLDGEKIKGGYALIRTDSDNLDGNWLLIKMDDDYADARRKPTSTDNKSVLTGRTISQIRNDDKGK